MNNLEHPREAQFCPKNEIDIGIKVDTEELNSAITKAKELVALLREANELQSSLPGNQIITDDTPDLIGNLAKMKRSPLREMIDRICLLQFDCKSEYEVKVVKCNEFIKTVKEMQGTELEPYLAETKCTTSDRCYNITFKIPIDLDNKSENLQ